MRVVSATNGHILATYSLSLVLLLSCLRPLDYHLTLATTT